MYVCIYVSVYVYIWAGRCQGIGVRRRSDGGCRCKGGAGRGEEVMACCRSLGREVRRVEKGAGRLSGHLQLWMTGEIYDVRVGSRFFLLPIPLTFSSLFSLYPSQCCLC